VDAFCERGDTMYRFMCPYGKLDSCTLFDLLAALQRYDTFPEWTKRCNDKESVFCRICHSNCRALACELQQRLGTEYTEFIAAHSARGLQ
jgi:hypothetical protein